MRSSHFLSGSNMVLRRNHQRPLTRKVRNDQPKISKRTQKRAGILAWAVCLVVIIWTIQRLCNQHELQSNVPEEERRWRRCHSPSVMNLQWHNGTNSFTSPHGAAVGVSEYASRQSMWSLNLRDCDLHSYEDIAEIMEFLQESDDAESKFSLYKKIQQADLSENFLTLQEIERFVDNFQNLKILFVSDSKIPLSRWVHPRSRPTSSKEIIVNSKLQLLCLKSSGLTYIDDDILPESLRWLILTNNSLSQLPVTGGVGSGRYGPNLLKLALSSNMVQELPLHLEINWNNLELVRVAHNPLSKDSVKRLCSLSSLAYVGIVGSLDSFQRKNLHRLVQIDNHSTELPNLAVTRQYRIVIRKELGKGASGKGFLVDFIDRGMGSVSILPRRDAVFKVFHSLKGGTDGNALDEIAAQSTVNHPSLVKALALSLPNRLNHKRDVSNSKSSLVDTDADTGLVLEYVPRTKPLAKPPSLTSTSRDVYGLWDSNDSLLQTKKGLLTLLTSMAQAGYYLHGNGPGTLSPRIGLAHGDFYGHNILVQRPEPNTNDLEQKILLSDFGASFFYDKGEDPELAGSIEGIEIRAWGILALENVLRYVVFSSSLNRQNLNHVMASLIDLSNQTTIEDGYRSFFKKYNKNLSQKLIDVVLECWRPQKPLMRPRFEHVVSVLKLL